MVSAVCLDVLSSLLAVSAETQDKWYNFYMFFDVSVKIDPVNQFAPK